MKLDKLQQVQLDVKSLKKTAPLGVALLVSSIINTTEANAAYTLYGLKRGLGIMTPTERQIDISEGAYEQIKDFRSYTGASRCSGCHYLGTSKKARSNMDKYPDMQTMYDKMLGEKEWNEEKGKEGGWDGLSGHRRFIYNLIDSMNSDIPGPNTTTKKGVAVAEGYDIPLKYHPKLQKDPRKKKLAEYFENLWQEEQNGNLPIKINWDLMMEFSPRALTHIIGDDIHGNENTAWGNDYEWKLKTATKYHQTITLPRLLVVFHIIDSGPLPSEVKEIMKKYRTNVELALEEKNENGPMNYINGVK